MKNNIKQKAQKFLELHQSEDILILPNIWDVIGGKLLEKIGFKAIATASMSMAYSQGYQDGEHLPFKTVLRISKEISEAVDIPVSVDFEKGYADSLEELSAKTAKLIDAGIVGINIEDGSRKGGKGLTSIENQSERIHTIRQTAINKGVHLVINARTDIFLNSESQSNNELDQAIKRGIAYKDAGADCFYPILLSNIVLIEKLVKEIKIPVNIFLIKTLVDFVRLKEIGVSRVSLGPLFLKRAISSLKTAAERLFVGDPKALFSEELVSTDFIENLGLNRSHI